ncbi:MAG: hypothetical protein A3I05_05280 [Deltaproteobacteria bacterium RIFCSPLOWO2_02_FULL_44_10]|nr:MAG: hypothetical protein A3I05_05280 [Deltaproteobacteria bacterium RIFCSPLOWO2_02_FULL_44_10]
MNKLTLKSLFLVSCDVLFLTTAFLLSCFLVDFPIVHFLRPLLFLWPLLLAAHIALFVKCGLYRASLRYASVDFVATIFKAVTMGIFLVILTLYAVHIQLSLRVLFLSWLLSLFFVGGVRFSIRYLFDQRYIFRRGRRVLVYGAGDAGVLALRQLRMSHEVAYSPLAFLDDDPKKLGNTLQGVKVIGAIDRLEALIDELSVEEVVVAISEIKGEKLRSIVKRCRQKGVVCRIIPCFSKMLEMEPKMRNIELADLMRRAPRDLDKHVIRHFLQGKIVLVTGAAGSIGSELVRQTLKYGPRLIIAVDHSEYGLYALREELGDHLVQYVVGNVTNRAGMQRIFKETVPEIVFHAAAYKHVPLLENNALEAISNNVGGTQVVAELADLHGVQTFVLISTDKAVKPSRIMGATKRICELFVQNFNERSKTKYVSVRFGNVLGSSGSVIPKFLKQIQARQTVTITHPEATRYFMLIDEAVQLVLQSAAIGQGGEIFILNMGEPVKIAEMAEDLIYLMGFQPHRDISIESTGLRPGEKMVEELFHDEMEEKTQFEDITIGRMVKLDWDLFVSKLSTLFMHTQCGDHIEAVEALWNMISDEKLGEATKKSLVKEIESNLRVLNS